MSSIKTLRMVAPDYSLISCVKCGSHDVGGANKTVWCHNCNQTIKAGNLKDATMQWNNAQLASLTTAANTVSVDDAKDAEMYRYLRKKDLTEMNTPCIAIQLTDKSGTFVSHEDADNAIREAITQEGKALLESIEVKA